MKSRLALTFVLVTGLLMSGTGATLAVTGIAGDEPAAVSQYDAPGEDGSGNLGDQAEGEAAPGSGSDGGGVAGDDSASADQVAAGGDSLPFTGLLVFPLLIGGVALVAAGTVLRRRV